MNKGEEMDREPHGLYFTDDAGNDTLISSLPESEKEKIRKSVQIVENGNQYNVRIKRGLDWVLVNNDTQCATATSWIMPVPKTPSGLKIAKRVYEYCVDKLLRLAESEYNQHEWREVKLEGKKPSVEDIIHYMSISEFYDRLMERFYED